MTPFFLTFLATALAILAGRDAVLVARLSAAHGRAGALYAAIALAALAFAAIAAWLAGGLAGGLEAILQGAAARLFVAVALGVAGIELLLLGPGKTPAEPTRSLGATTIVLLATLLTGAPGFLVLAFAVLGGNPMLAAAGGALGAMAALAAANLAAADWEKLPLVTLRMAGGALLLVAALVTGYLALASA